VFFNLHPVELVRSSQGRLVVDYIGPSPFFRSFIVGGIELQSFASRLAEDSHRQLKILKIQKYFFGSITVELGRCACFNGIVISRLNSCTMF